MSRLSKLFFAFLALTLLAGAAMAADGAKPKYVFLFIGDGMSIPQRMVADEFSKLTTGEGLALETFDYEVPTTTRSADAFITDSAAGGTALACGTKTNNHWVGVAPDGSRLTSTAEVARDAGKKVGIITSVTLNHATPAAFYGHQQSRSAGYALGLDLIASNFDFFGGGGLDRHNDEKNELYKGDIYELAKEAGYIVTHDPEEIKALEPGCGKVLACQKEGALPYAIDDDSGLRIADYLSKAIELIDNENGFFIMTEGGKVDWMCHANDAATTIREVIDLDAAVKVALKFAEEHKGETLIVVTGDHETGGLTLGFVGTGYKPYIERLAFQTCSKEALTARCNDLAKELGDDMKFEDFQPVITEATGLLFDGDKDDPMKLKDEELATLKSAYGRHKKADMGALVSSVIEIFDGKAGLAWTSGGHTALPVKTSATGVGADLFHGHFDNTDVAKVLKSLVVD